MAIKHTAVSYYGLNYVEHAEKDFIEMKEHGCDSNEEICNKRDALMNRTAEIYATAPKTSPKSYSEVQKALKSEEEQFFTMEELNQLMPQHIRDSLNIKH